MALKRQRQKASTPLKKRKTNSTKANTNAPISNSQSSNEPIQQDSHLLELPSEVLTHILSFVLVRDDGNPILLRSANQRRWRNEIADLLASEWGVRLGGPPNYNSAVKAVTSRTKSDLLRVLLVSRDFYFAGVAAFFGGNILKFESTADLARMADKLDIDRRRHIARVMIERDLLGDKAESMKPSDINEVHDPEALYLAMGKLPALKEVYLDFKMGGGAPPFIWGRLRTHMDVLKMHFASISDKLRFATDGKPADRRDLDWAVAKKFEKITKVVT